MAVWQRWIPNNKMWKHAFIWTSGIMLIFGLVYYSPLQKYLWASLHKSYAKLKYNPWVALSKRNITSNVNNAKLCYVPNWEGYANL